mmetsp:Transcript_101019/g.184306  ORF Transcript_101019/g.184306 Transcript_101019/m.184306 type:complete len:507 (+) Transcript_101019:117-1637(+)
MPQGIVLSLLVLTSVTLPAEIAAAIDGKCPLGEDVIAKDLEESAAEHNADGAIQMLQAAARKRQQETPKAAAEIPRPQEDKSSKVCQEGLRGVLAEESEEGEYDSSMYLELLQTARRALRKSSGSESQATESSSKGAAGRGEPVADHVHIKSKDAREAGAQAERDEIVDTAPTSFIQHSVKMRIAGTDFDSSSTAIGLLALVGLVMLLQMCMVKSAKSTQKAVALAKEEPSIASPVPPSSPDVASTDSKTPPAATDSKTLRTYVNEFPVSSFSDVQDLLSAKDGYDCPSNKPFMSGRALRLQARIEGPVGGRSGLVAPLTQKECVFYHAAAQCHSKPPAFACMHRGEDFVVSLADAPWIQVEVEVQHAYLFDTSEGKMASQHALLEAPEHLQDFVFTHTNVDPEKECENNSALRAGEPRVEFQEHVLRIGSVVTLVGELYRSPDGRLSLGPWRDASFDELGLSDQDLMPAARDAFDKTDAKVAGVLLVSDSPALMKKAAEAAVYTV